MMIEATAKRIAPCGYVYTWHWLRYDMHCGRYEALRILFAARLFNGAMEGWV
jgi:hypothetical protein